MLTSFETIGVKMNLKIHFLHYHINQFAAQLATESDEHGEKFHQVAAPMETWYKGKSLKSLMGELCWQMLEEQEDEDE